MRDHHHPDPRRSLATICKNVAVAVSIASLVIAFFAEDTFELRFHDAQGMNWRLLGKWIGAAVICLTIGVCLAAICRRRADSDK